MKPASMQIRQTRLAIENIQSLGDDCWHEIEPLFYLRKLNKYDYFSKEAQLTHELGIILSGVMRIFYLSDDGEEWNKNFLQKNDFVAASISPEKKSITNIQALTEVVVCCISFSKLMRIALKYSQVNVLIQKITYEYLEQKQNREIRLLSKDAMQNYLNFKDTFPNLEGKIQQYHIASYLGITPTQLSRLKKKAVLSTYVNEK